MNTKNTKGIVGVVIRDDVIRVLQLEWRHGMASVFGAGSVPLPEGAVASGMIVDPQVIAATLREACSRATPHPIQEGGACVVALPESKTFLRIVHLPRMSQTEMAEALMWEMEGYIPLPVEDVYYDWQKIPNMPTDAPEHTAVIVAAAARSIVDAYVESIEQSGMHIVGIEPDSIADARALATEPADDHVLMIIACHALQTRMTIVAYGVPIFTVTVPVGTTTMIADVQRALGISRTEADRMLADDGIGSYISHDPLFNAVEPTITLIAEEMRKSADFCMQTLAQCHTIARVVFVGGGSEIRGLRAFLVQRTGLPIDKTDPWINVPHDAHTLPAMSQEDASDAVTAIGLALRTMDYADFS